MSKGKLTKQIESMLYSYSPIELAGQKLNKFRPHFVVNECVVETGNIRNGIVDVVRLDETLVNKRVVRRCSGYNLVHSSDKNMKQYYHDWEGSCGKVGSELPRECENETCDYNYPEYVYDYELLLTCFEIKVTKADFHSNNGHNFCGNANFYVMPRSLYKEVKDEIPDFVGVIVVDDGPNTVVLRKVKEAVFRDLSDSEKLWLALNILKKHSKEQRKDYEKKLDEAYSAESKAKGDLWALQMNLRKEQKND